MNQQEMQVSYGLNKQVPAMERGFTISTSYGDIEVSADEAQVFAELARSMFAKRLQEARAEG